MWITRLVDNRAWCFWLKLSTWARLTQHALLACASCDGPQKPDPDLSRVEQLLFRKNMKKLRWLFIWQITLSQFYNVSVRFKSASSGNKLEHLEGGLIISFFFCATNAIGLCLCVFCSWFCFAPCSGASQCLGSMWVSLKALIIFFVRLLYLLFIVW